MSIEEVYNFFSERLVRDKPLLVGVSGGPDSMALLSIAWEWGVPCYVAHIDHKLRFESTQEAEQVRAWVDVRTPGKFFLKSLSIPENTKNLEDVCRKERLQFFQEMYHKVQAQALLLGHQADEQVETTLKRFFEGASLSHMGIQEDLCMMGMRILRPLLRIRKSVLIEYLQEKNIPYLTDPTNASDHNLRGRMRGSLIPILEDKFGKSIYNNILRFSARCEKVEELLEEYILPLEEGAITGPFGTCIPIPEDINSLLVEHLVKKRGATNKHYLHSR